MRAKAKTIIRALEGKYSRFIQWLLPLPYSSTDGKDAFNWGEEIYPCLCTHKHTIWNAIQLLKKAQINAICSNMDGPRDCDSE